jgi:hypothetical protein
MIMNKVYLIGNQEISDEMIVAAQIYIGTSGAIEDPTLVMNKAFAEDMLESILNECGIPFGNITDEMQVRAVEYFSRYLDRTDPMAATYSSFVEGVLSYALLGVDFHTIEGDSEVTKFPAVH